MSYAIGSSTSSIVIPSALRGQSPELSEAVRGFGSEQGKKAAAVTETELALIEARLAAESAGAPRQASALRAPPLLAAPKAASDDTSSLYELLALVRNMAFDADAAELKFRMETFTARSQAKQAHFTSLSDALFELHAAYEQSVQAAMEAGTAAAEATKAAQNASAEVERLEAAVDEAAAGSPERQALEAELVTARAVLSQAEGTARAAAAAFTAANEKAIAAGEAAGVKASEIDALIAGMPGSAGVPVNLSHEAKLTELMAIISELLADAAMDGLSEDLALQERRLEAQRVENEKRAKEIEEQARKAAEAQKTMGSIGKLISYALAVVAVVVAVASLGTAAVVSAGMIAMAVASSAMLATMVVGDIAGYDLIGKALSPITEGIFSPIVDFITKAAVDIFGEEAGRWIGTVLAAVVIVAMIAAVVFVTKQVGPAAQKMLGPVLKGVMDKVVPQVASSAMKQMFKPVIKAVSSVAAKRNAMVTNFSEKAAERVAIATTYAGRVQTGLMVTQTGVSVGGAAWKGSLDVELAKRMSAMENAMLNNQMLRDMRATMYEKMEHQLAVIDELLATISEALSTSLAGKLAMLQHSTSSRA